MSNQIVYATAVHGGKLVQATVTPLVDFVGTKFENRKVRITNRNGDSILCDNDSLAALIAALQIAEKELSV